MSVFAGTFGVTVLVLGGKFLHYLIFSPKADHSIMFYFTKLKIFTDDVVVVDHSTLCHYVRYLNESSDWRNEVTSSGGGSSQGQK